MMNKKVENKDNAFKQYLKQWLMRVDTKDKSLKPGVRKWKWLFILSILFVLFAASFIWDPMVQVSKNKLEILDKPKSLDKKSLTPTFEMPVDSFELHLKRSIHENIPEKE